MRQIYAVQIENGKKVRRWIGLEDRKCGICGRRFSPLRQNSEYCCRECCKRAESKKNTDRYKKRSKKYYEDHKIEISEKRKQQYQENPDYWKSKSREWGKSFREKKRSTDRMYKDKIRHGSKREKLIKENGLVCSKCGKLGNRYQIITHHITFDPQDHNEQELLCQSCHRKIHGKNVKEIKPLTKDQIQMALETSFTLDEACKKLDIGRSSLYVKRRRLGLPSRIEFRGVKKVV